MPDRYAILQLQETNETAWERFMNLAWLREHGMEPNPEHYDLVYVGRPQQEWEHPLEEIFVKFNTELPSAFLGRSMSTSDIVAIQTNGQATKYYYCDSIGFKHLTEFKHPEVERAMKEP